MNILSLRSSLLCAIAGLTHLAALVASESKPASSEAMSHQKSEVVRGVTSPIKAIHAHLCGLHFLNGDLRRQVIAHHYCAHVRDDLWQCVLYDSDRADARLIGIEYVIPESVFVGLPAEEKVLWHSHRYEVAAGLLVASGLDDGAQQKLMTELVTSYGKTWHTWQIERGDLLPLGLPKLMMGFTADGQARPALLAERDRAQGINAAEIGRQRSAMAVRPIAAGADAWQQGVIVQISDDQVTQHLIR